MRRLGVSLLLTLLAVSASAASLTISKAGPIGEMATLAEANEIRVVFSEPMVALGKIPKELHPAWFHVEPAIKGTFRWAGTTTLIFTPDPKTPLPFATKYDVTIDADATAVSGRKLGKPYTFSFVTPTIQLQSTNWYRKGHRYDGPVVIGLRFNQPVGADTIAPHLQLRYTTHDIELPSNSGNDPAYGDKASKASEAALRTGNVLSFFPTEWDEEKLGKGKDLVVVETKPGVPPDSALQVYLDEQLAKSPKHVVSGKAQEYTIELEPTFFVKGFTCTAKCNPEAYNPLMFRTASGADFTAIKKAIHVTDVTDPAHPQTVKPGEAEPRENGESSNSYSLDELGYTVMPAHNYEVRIDPKLTAVDGQQLGYTWSARVEFWHKSAFTSFGDGHGVWESTGGPLLPFYSRNFLRIDQWLAPVTLENLMPTIQQLEKDHFHLAPSGVPAQERKLSPVPDKIQSYGLNVGPALNAKGFGLAWAAVQEQTAIPNSERYVEAQTRATVVQVTNLGISVKDSPQNTLIFVTRLDDGAPVAGAKVSIRMDDNKVFWTGTTDANGLAVAPNTALRVRVKKNEKGEEVETGGWWEVIDRLLFIVTAEKDGDVAYVASNWSEGVGPYDFDLPFSLAEAHPLLRGKIFTDRGVYKAGEEVHFKGIFRSDTPTGMELFKPGTEVQVSITDAHDNVVAQPKVKLNEWSSAEFTWTVPSDAVLGTYTITAATEKAPLEMGDFLVAAYRRPDFRVDAKLTGPNSIAGTKLDGHVTGRYLFGAPMSNRPVAWTYTKSPVFDVPSAIDNRWSSDHWTFLGEDYQHPREKATVESKQQKLDAKGELRLTLPTDLTAGWPWRYQIEGEVTDVSRQKIAGRASMRIDPAPWYIGVQTPQYFTPIGSGLDTAVVAAGLDGMAVAGVNVKLELHRIQFNSVRKAEGNGFYTWETERKEVPAGDFSVTTQTAPAPLHIPLKEGGEYLLIATAKDAEGRSTTTRVWFYGEGEGYTAWERYDNNRIDLEPEKKTVKPGESARIMIKSPWEHATALVTTEREAVRTWREFPLTSTQQTITVPITEKDIPNVFVSVLLLKGRTKEGIEEEADPGKPAFRLGYVELEVEDASKKLKVDVKANREEYRPATKAKIEVNVSDPAGKGEPAEVTLWAVDYGVLSLTDYQTPNVLESMYLRKSLQVVTDDSRQKIVSRRVLTPKGATDGGGGGRDAGPGVIRKDFRVLAFWLGSIVTDRRGHAKTEVTLPESLTTYRIMAVAGDKASRFGLAQAEIRISKPVLLTSAFPRFLALGDQAYFGSVVHSTLKSGGKATVTMRSLDPNIVEIGGDAKEVVDVGPEGSVEVRFHAAAKSVGIARLQMSVSLNGETDAFEDTLPVRLLLPADTVAAYGEAKPTATETLDVPKDAVPSIGGLHLELSSTAMVGLSEGASYLVTYPYGCAEQRSSAALSLMVASDLGDAFNLPGIDAKQAHTIAQKTIYELYKYQCGDGGFVFWAGECGYPSSPYVTAWVLHVMQRAQKLKYDVNVPVVESGYHFLDESLKEKRPLNEGWWPAYTAWQAFAVKVLTEGGKNEDSNINRLYSYADRMPLFGISYLADALVAKNDRGPKLQDLERRMTNAILPEAGTAHVEELHDDYLLWFWNSNVRTTAIVMGSLARAGDDEDLVKQMVRWLMKVRQQGRWGNTQENAWAMESLVDYYRKYESETPDFTAVVNLGNEVLDRETFRGRTTESKVKDVEMAKLPKASTPVTFERQGTGTLFYMLRLKYASDMLMRTPRDQGIAVERHYAVQGSKTDATSFKAGDLIKVTLKIHNTKERRYVAVTDPIPAGTEPVESWFATTATELSEQQQKEEAQNYDWMSWWQHGGFDHVERHDDRVDLFATRLSEGAHEFSYVLRATTAGTFTAAPMRAEEMYEPEVFGRTSSATVEVKP